jgi:SulP family sulfate permease
VFAVLIALSQVKEFLGLQIPKLPGEFFGMASTLLHALPTFSLTTTVLSLGSLALIVLWQFVVPRWVKNPEWNERLRLVPGSVLALVVATVVVAVFKLPVETIGTKFGGVPNSLPSLQLPAFSWETVRFLFIPATTLAMLGAIESLLCARVADSMIDDRHNPNQELMAQGIANFFTPFFGGMPATGTIARTVTNVKGGGRTPVAGIVHALTLLVVMLVAAPLAQDIPLAAMAAILMFVAWNMGEWREFWHLRQFRMPYRATLLAVFFLTVVFDLTVAVEVGLVAACITFIYRISSLSRSEAITVADFPALVGLQGRVAVHRLYGALFFGAVKMVEELQDHLPKHTLVLDLKNVIYVDSSGADTLIDLVRTCKKNQVRLVVCGLMHQPLDIATRCGFADAVGPDNIYPDLARAVQGIDTLALP